MKLIYTFLFTAILLLASCVDEYDSGNDHTLTKPHNYDSMTSNSGYQELDQIIKDKENPNRNDWQKPREVIRMMGDLSNKVIADIGAGYGYFAFQLLPYSAKVIAIEVSENAINKMDSIAQVIATKPNATYIDKLELRLVGYDDPKLKDQEVDIVLISNTYYVIENRVDYLKNVFKGVKSKGRIYIVDYKMKKLPPNVFPPASERVPLFEVERQLEEAGFRHVFSDDQTLDYQYIVIAEKE